MKVLVAICVLAVTIASVSCGNSTVTNLTVTPAVIAADATINIVCTVQSASSPTVSFRKWFGNYTSRWSISNNEDQDDSLASDSANADRFKTVLSSNVGQTYVYTLTIYNAKNEDSANYTCKTTTSSMTVLVNVPTEPNNVTLYLNDQLVAAGERRYVQLNGHYKLACVVTGGNPFPNVTLSSGVDMPGPVSLDHSYMRGPEMFAKVSSQTTVTVIGWTADVRYIGRPLVCAAGVLNSKAVSVNFIPVTNHTEPMFNCNDTATLPGDQGSLIIECFVYSQPSDLKQVYVHWHSTVKNYTISGDLTKTQPKANDDDAHFSLAVFPPESSDKRWWRMSLKVSGVRTYDSHVDGTVFRFVAINDAGTAQHTVRAIIAGVRSDVAGVANPVAMYLSGLIAGMTAVVVAVVRL